MEGPQHTNTLSATGNGERLEDPHVHIGALIKKSWWDSLKLQREKLVLLD